MNWDPLILTFKLATVTTVLLFLIAVPLSFWLSVTKTRLKPVIEALVSMPLVLPPTVLGFYLLIAFSPNNAFGNWLDQWLGIKLVFSFSGLVFASVLYSLPFMVTPIHSGLSAFPASIKEAAYVMGKSRWTTLIKVQLPIIKKSVITGIVLAFAHTVGEFGVVLMIGGNIPGKTKVASIEIYDQVEALNYDAAGTYAAILFLFSFMILFLVYLFNESRDKR